MKVAVLGAGSWGTTLSLLLTRNVRTVQMWEFRPEAVRKMRADRENKEFLPGIPFPGNLDVTDDIREAVSGAEICISAVPSHAVRGTAERLAEGLSDNCLLVSASKGIEQGSLMRISEIFADVWKERFDPQRYASLSGPSHAEEVSIGLPTSVVVASTNLQTARRVQELVSSERFRAYSTDDLIGVELGGSMKNVVAIAAGISAGLGFGDNTLGALLTRGLAEMTRLAKKLGARSSTLAGLSGMGDLITTCCSRHSRNRHVGVELGRGKRLDDILAGMHMVAEGVRTTASVYALSQRENIVMPITQQTYRILFENANPLEATTDLMIRSLKMED